MLLENKKRTAFAGGSSHFLGVFAGASRYTCPAPIFRSTSAAAAAVEPVVMISSTSTTDCPERSTFSSGSSARAAFFLPRGKIFLLGLRGVNGRLRMVARQGRFNAAAIGLASSSGLIVAAFVQMHKADRHVGDQGRASSPPAVPPAGEAPARRTSPHNAACG